VNPLAASRSNAASKNTVLSRMASGFECGECSRRLFIEPWFRAETGCLVLGIDRKSARDALYYFCTSIISDWVVANTGLCDLTFGTESFRPLVLAFTEHEYIPNLAAATLCSLDFS
jgi:hypothetical protein